MFIELVDVLRCPAAHPDGHLVAAPTRMAARRIVDGLLGCPECKRRYTVTNGVLQMCEAPAVHEPSDSAPAAAAATALHLAAWLALTEPGGFVVVTGGWANHATELAALAGVHVIALDPVMNVAPGDDVSVVQACGHVPFGSAVLRGVAVDVPSLGTPAVADAWLARATLALRPGARLLAPAACASPPGTRDVASDERWRIAERDAPASGPVSIGRARPGIRGA